MKNILVSFSNFAICIFSVLLCNAAQSQNRNLLVLATQNLPPYQLITEGEMSGLAIRRVICALDAINFNYEIVMTDWSAAQRGTENGKYDGFFVGSKNSRRKQFSTASTPVVSEDLAWFTLSKSKIDPLDPTKKFSARYSAKYNTSKWKRLYNQGYNVVMRPNDAKSLIKMLKAGDIDVALEYELIFEHFRVELGLTSDQFNKIRDRTNDMSVFFSNKFLAANPSFLDTFNINLKKCVSEIQ
jgi:polar amino acid transport system substrate-binding protein